MNKSSFHVSKGDKVLVITGNNRGQVGSVLQVLPKKKQVLVEGVSLIKRHQRASQSNPAGGVVEREGPLSISNVRLFESREGR